MFFLRCNYKDYKNELKWKGITAAKILEGLGENGW